MLVPRSVSARKNTAASTAAARLPSLAEASVLLAQRKEQCRERSAVIHRGQHALIDSHGQATLEQRDETGALVAYASARTQNSPLDGELSCAVCARLGACLSNAAGQGVCSIECKEHEIRPTQGLVYGPLLQGSHTMPAEDSATYKLAPAGATDSYSHSPSYSGNRMIANVTGYRESPRIETLSSKDIDTLRQVHQIHISGKHLPKPILSFEDCSLPDKMLANLAKNGYAHPRSIQMQVIPSGLCGRDMILSAETGAGKTAAYLIPVLTHAYGLAQLPGDGMEGPYALIVAPTRELAVQIEDVAKSIVCGMPNMRTALLVGGQAMANQAHRLKQNIQIAVATPGRMVDIFAKHGDISFSNVFCLVLDEVDLMISMGFRKQIKRILDVLPEPPNGRQTILCSATISRQVEQFVNKWTHNHLRIRVGGIKERVERDAMTTIKFSDVFSPASKIKQTIMWVENGSKKKALLSLLKDPTYFRPPVLVFVDSRIGADLLAHTIQVKCHDITCISMHGDKPLDERSAIVKSIKEGEVQVMVATGLLARGLDLKVATVVNFDMAPSIQEYVHRVGRASPEAATKAAEGIRRGPRLGGMAWAITFINHDHNSILGEFANMLHKLDIERVTPLPSQLKQLIRSEPSGQKSTAPVVSVSDKKDASDAGSPVGSTSKRIARTSSGQPKQHPRKKRVLQMGGKTVPKHEKKN